MTPTPKLLGTTHSICMQLNSDTLLLRLHRDVYASNQDFDWQETETKCCNTLLGQCSALSYFWVLLTSS